MTNNKNKTKKIAKKPVVEVFEDFPVFTTTALDNEVAIDFETEYEKINIQWNYPKTGRQLQITMSAEIESLELYKKLHQNHFGSNFIKAMLIDDSEEAINLLFEKLKLSKLLFDCIIIEAAIEFNDPADNFYGEFSHYHGIGLTVHGRKYLQDVLAGN